MPDRAALTGIIFVLKSGIPWEMLPRELGCGSGMTCWRRLRDWQEAGVWERLHRALLDRLGEPTASTGAAPAWTAPASRQKGGRRDRPEPDGSRQTGHEAPPCGRPAGIPLAVLLTGANVHDSMVFEDVLDAIAPIKRPRGRPRKRPAKLHADKAYDSPRCRRALRARHITGRIARKGIESSERLGRHRWVVERTLAWLNRFRRLTVRYERRADIHEAFLTLGCALICLNAISRFC